MATATTHDYINEFKDRAREAFGKFAGKAKEVIDETDKEALDLLQDLEHEVNGILGEPTPSALVEAPVEEAPVTEPPVTE